MKDKVQQKLFLWILIVYVVVLMIGAVITIPKGVVTGNTDKYMHFLEFFGLSLIIVKTLQVFRAKLPYIMGFVVSCIIGLLSEIVQLATITRTFSVYDLLADLIGIIVGLVFFRLVVSKWKF